MQKQQTELFTEVTANVWDDTQEFLPLRPYRSVELFAGAGGLALGMELAGFTAMLLNEIDKYACATLRRNRPEWNVIEESIVNLDFKDLHNKVDILSGGFPCQTFSYAGNGLGFNDTRGTMFFEFARAINEIKPKILLGENVRGILNHDGGKTLSVIKSTIKELGYNLITPRVLSAKNYKVPQKRERLFLIAIRNDLINSINYLWPTEYHRELHIVDAFKSGELYPSDVPFSEGQKYPEKKRAILDLVPAGGCWRDLPDHLQREYMKGSYFLGGGKTGMARRLAWNEPSLTLTCAPAQNQTERCHPSETRPLTVREYARIQTFPDSWIFEGSMSQQYKQRV